MQTLRPSWSVEIEILRHLCTLPLASQVAAARFDYQCYKDSGTNLGQVSHSTGLLTRLKFLY